ncbi:MAG: FHA domain-containing protein [Planctomycetota bacterium]
MSFLEVRHDGDSQVVSLSKLQIVGRDESSDIVLNDHRCSRQHLRIEFKGGSWRLVDLGSSNGVLVNGNAVSQKRLADGDCIVIGDYELFFWLRLEASAAANPNEDVERSAGESPTVPSRSRKLPVMPLVFGLLLCALAGTWFFNDKSKDGSPSKVIESSHEDTTSLSGTGSERGDLESLGSDVGEPESDAAVADKQLLSKLLELQQGTTPLPLDDLEFELVELSRQARLPATRRQIEDLRRHWVGRVERRFRTELGEVSELAAQRVAAGKFGDALELYDAFGLEADVAGAGELKLESTRRRLNVLKQARHDWEQVRAGLDRLGGTWESARMLLEQKRRDYRGTHFESLARSELRTLELRRVVAAKTETATAASDSPTRTRSRRRGAVKLTGTAAEALALVSKAEGQVAVRNWRHAADNYERAIGLIEDRSLSTSWGLRRDLLGSYTRLKAAVIIGINDEDRALKSVRIGRLTAAPFAADEDKIELKFGRSRIVTWTWIDLTLDRMIEFFAKAARTPEDKIHFGRVAFDLGQNERAEVMLARAAKRSEHRAGVDRVLAAHRGIEVPTEGFKLYDGHFYTPKEYRGVARRVEAKKLGKKIPRAQSREFAVLVQKLKALGADGRDALKLGLKDRLTFALVQARSLKMFKSPAGARRKLLKALEGRREEALDLIYDAKRYPYPYAANGDEIQAEVNGLREKVRKIWEEPAQALLDYDDKWREVNESIQDLESRLGDQGAGSAAAALMKDANEVLALQDAAWSTARKKRRNEVLKFNAEIKSSVSKEEREAHRLTNVYRMQMGLLPLKIDEALVLAARGHSQEMKDLGYFAHNSPTPSRRTPSQRGQLAGWGGGIAENIAQGQRSPAAVVTGWINSSGHHRNILGRRHTHLGCGKAKNGFYWTQNFGTGSSSKISKEKTKVPKTASK